jgi:alginate O-acetyltransferase complex protein AlgI
MQFNSLAFLLFAVLFFAFWPIANRRNNLRWGYLVAASFIFLGWADWRCVVVLVVVGLISFVAGLGMKTYPSRRRIILVLALSSDLGLLAFFKYRALIAVPVTSLLPHLGPLVSQLEAKAQLITPPTVAMSFYIFQAVSYLLDIYKDRLEPARNPLHFFAYLSLFPKLLAGPIERGKSLLPQLLRVLPVTEEQRWQGFKSIVFGFFLKLVIADNLAPVVDVAFATLPLPKSSLYWWCVITVYAFQVYCDFDGYSHMAMGFGKWMGYNLTLNFNYPYTSTTLGEFWARWHITLSSWLRDYIFFPLNRSRLGRGRPDLSMLITMLISGLWHGAAPTFLVWGGLHALYISVERLTQWPARVKRFKGGAWLALGLVLFQVWIAWVFFRAPDLNQALTIVRAMFSFSGGAAPVVGATASFALGLAIVRELTRFLGLHQKSWWAQPWLKPLEVVGFSVLIIACVYLRGAGSQFVYFQF